MSALTPSPDLPRASQHALHFVALALLLAMFGCAQSAAEESESASASLDERPNILIILADDMGFSDAGSYGGEIQTPNIDRLAENGLRFTQFYNTSRCVPTRASLLTGLYAHKAGLGGMTMNGGEPGYQGHLNEQTVTMAEVLKEAGYQTGLVGKWHVSTTERRPEEEQLAWLAHQAGYAPFSPLDQYPTARGFDDYYGTIWGVVDYFDPFSLVNGTEPVEDVPDDFYMATAIDLAGTEYPETFEGREMAPLDGKSLLPILQGQTREGHEYLYWEHFGARALRHGAWKLVSVEQGAPWELYNLETDRTELNDLADEQPERVNTLAAKWETWAERAHVLPRP